MSVRLARKNRIFLSVAKCLRWIILALVTIWVLFPIWWASIFSFKGSVDFFGAKLIPFVQFNPTLSNWRLEWDSFFDSVGLAHELSNSLISATGSTALSLTIGILAAFGLLQRHRARLSVWPFVFLFFLPRIVPSVIVAFPFTSMMRRAGLHDTLGALIIAHTTLALPFVIPVLYVTLLELPPDVFEAAQIDGARSLTVIRDMILPLSLPVLITIATICFALSWNEFIFALTNSQRFADTAPVSVIGLDVREGVQFEYVGSHLVLVMLPPLILALLAKRFIVRGLTLGAVREDRSEHGASQG